MLEWLHKPEASGQFDDWKSFDGPVLEAKPGVSVAEFSILTWGGPSVVLRKFFEVQAWRIVGPCLVPMVGSLTLNRRYLSVFEREPKLDYGWVVRVKDESMEPPFLYAIGGYNNRIGVFVSDIEPGNLEHITSELKKAGNNYWSTVKDILPE